MLVSNSSTLILLAKISLLRKFLENSPDIFVPEEVRNEMLNSNSLDAKIIEKEITEKNILVEKADRKTVQNIMKDFRLDEGEAAAFSLYKKEKHKLIITDDGELIKLCKIQNIKFSCAIAITLRLYQKKSITKQEALEKMKKLDEIGRYSKSIYEYHINEVEKNGNNISKN